MLNRLIQYFDLYADLRARGATMRGATPATRTLSAWPQWLALLAGVLVQPYLTEYRTAGLWNFELSQFWGWLLFAVIAAVIIFPTVYKKAFDPEKPLLIQLIPIFTAGLGWEALFGAAVKAVGGG